MKVFQITPQKLGERYDEDREAYVTIVTNIIGDSHEFFVKGKINHYQGRSSLRWLIQYVGDTLLEQAETDNIDQDVDDDFDEGF